MDNVFNSSPCGPRAQEMAALKAALAEGNGPEVEALLAGAEPFAREDASELLLAAVGGSSPLFLQMLNHCIPGEYGGWRTFTAAELGTKDWIMEVAGTLLTFAAALGRLDLVEELLRRGWDVNGSGLAAQNILLQSQPDFIDFSLPSGAKNRFYLAGRAAFRSNLVFQKPKPGGRGYLRVSVSGATPLAAAIYCGREAVVVRLLQEPGVWLGDCGPVSRGYLDQCMTPKTPVFRRIGALLRSKNAMPSDTLLTGLPPLLLYQIEATALLPQVYRQSGVSQDQGLALLRALEDKEMVMIFGMGKKAEEIRRQCFFLTLQRFPQLFSIPWVENCYLSHFLLPRTPLEPDPLLALYRRCRGDRMDLTFAIESLAPLPSKQLRAVVEGWQAAGLSLVLSEDAGMAGMGVRGMEVLLPRVQVLPSASAEGLGGLACAVLNSGSLRLVRQQLQDGILARTSVDLLMGYLDEHSELSALRALVLMCASRKEAPYEL